MDRSNPSIDDHRIHGLLLVVLGVFCFLSYGLIKRQIIDHSFYLKKEAYQNQRRIFIPAPRGNIYDRNHNLLVTNKPSFNLQIDFNDIRQEIKKEYQKLLKENRLTEKKIARYELQKQSRYNVLERYLAVANKITSRKETLSHRTIDRHYNEKLLLPITLLSNLNSQEYADLIDQLPIESPLYIVTNYFRYYPYKSAACHVLGYAVSAQEEDNSNNPLRTFQHLGKIGKTGLELALNDRLTGRNGEEIFAIDPAGFRANSIYSTPPVKGQDCTITLDIQLQQVAEEALGNKKGSVVVLDISSGEVLAMTSKPDYDINLLNPKISTSVYEEITARGAWLNRNIQGVYPPGSTFKILSSIAFLRNGISSWNPDDTTECKGRVKIISNIFKCDHSTAHGETNLASALMKSCNVYFYLRSHKCGIDKLYAEAKNFHLDQKTGIELPFESQRMTIPNAEWKANHYHEPWFIGDTTNTSIGQGYLLVSPLQMACFIASVASNRLYTIPHILPSNKPQTAPPIGLSKSQYTQLIATLQQVVDSGTGKKAQLKNHSCAGKSGTAQVWEHKQRKNVAWFIGFAPVEHPRVAICVTVQEESGNDNYYGGKTAAPISKKVLDFYFEKYSI